MAWVLPVGSVKGLALRTQSSSRVTSVVRRREGRRGGVPRGMFLPAKVCSLGLSRPTAVRTSSHCCIFDSSRGTGLERCVRQPVNEPPRAYHAREARREARQRRRLAEKDTGWGGGGRQIGMPCLPLGCVSPWRMRLHEFGSANGRSGCHPRAGPVAVLPIQPSIDGVVASDVWSAPTPLPVRPESRHPAGPSHVLVV